ncbi:MAG: S8 family serine peptidase, partial [Candidatus Eremiobacteraeota bacterium]|nr:S8 family serine peptidase [Candidatus Eremiobacteraeota bacterium]
AAPTPSGGTAGTASFAYGADALASAQYLGPADVGTLGVDVVLQAQNADGLVRYAAAVSDPHSPLYRNFLTPQQIGSSYGASASTVTSVASYFAAYGLHVGGWPQHLSLYVSGPQHALETALGTTFGRYQQGSTMFIAPRTTPRLARALPVTAMAHLVSLRRTYRTNVPVSGGADTYSGYSPQQIRNVFDYTGAYNAGFTGSGITLGIVGTGPMSAADVPAYGSMFATAVAPVTQVAVTDQGVAAPGLEKPPDTGFQTPPPVTATCSGSLPGCNPEDVEAQIDTEAAASLAPGAQVLFYLGYAPAFCIDNNNNLTPAPCASGTTPFPLLGLDVSDDEIQQVIADDKVDVLSLSYGGPEALNAAAGEFGASAPTTGLGPTEFAALAAEGVAVFASSGDAGAQGCQHPVYQAAIDQVCVSYPSTDPSVTAVGGVNAPLDRFGNLTNQMIGWGLTTGAGSGGSGGGVSGYFPQTLTPWQSGLPGVIGANRNVPDVSLLGDPATGMATLVDAAFGTQVGGSGGTSVAAPEMAAMWALVLQACASSSSCATAKGPKPYRLGNAAPLFYSLYAKGATIQPTYAQTFYDVVYGDNQQKVAQPGPTSPPLDPGYNAAPGYDQVTGIGVPFARALIKAVTHQ